MRIWASWVFAIVMTVVMLASTSAWEDVSPLVADIIFALATVLTAIAALGRLWCSLYIAGYKQRSLITEGPYSMCRNPLYFFSLIGAVGVGMATETLVVPAVILGAFAIYYPFVIRQEEAVMRERHGAAFEAYRASTPRFFPRFSQLHEPATYEVRPIVFRHHIASALWFVWLLGAAEIVEALHELHYVPSLFSVY